MYILKVILINSKRFVIGGYKRVEFTPKTVYQMILGKNGSGKTSLTEELTPLPADLKKTYNEGGGKIIYIQHDTIYKLQSGIDLGNKHSFIRDNKELNDGGTKKVQLELVFKYFGISQNIQDVVLNKKCFTSFSANDRKKWLQKIDTLDYTFVVSEFNKHNEELRNIKGALKVAVSRLRHDETILTQEEVKTFKEETRTLENEISTIIYKLNNSSDEVIVDDVKERLSESNVGIKELLDECEFGDNTTIDEVTANITKHEHTLNKLKNEEFRLTELITKNEDIDNAKTFEMGPLENEYTSLSKKFDSYDFEDGFELTPERIELLRDDFITHVKKLNMNIFKLQEYTHNEHLTLKDINYFRKSISDFTIKLRRKQDELIAVNAEISHMKQHGENDSVTCPKCNNIFKEKYDITTLEEMLIKSGTITTEMELINTKLINYSSTISDVDARVDVVNTITKLLDEERFKPFIFWTFIQIDYDLNKKYINLTNGLKVTIEKIESYMGYNEVNKNMIDLKNEIDSKLEIKNALNAVDINTDTVRSLKEELKLLEESITLLKSKLIIERLEWTKLDKLRTLISINVSLRKVVLNNTKQMLTNVEVGVLHEIKSTLVDRLKSINVLIEVNNKKLMEKKINDDNVNSLNMEKQRLELLVEALSPNKGIIGDAISSFMDTFLNKVNKIINTMWTYDLMIKPTTFDKYGNMDYNFPVYINGVKTLTDIREGSKAMLEIFNLAITLVSMEYLDMETYPIFLDEFASSMDVAHKNKAFKLLETIKGKHSQLFMISHFMEFYGGIANMDISVLSNDNIDMDNISVYNNVIELEQ